nr:extracellular solute-binding protein [uncultured Arthrobacter sp.]
MGLAASLTACSGGGGGGGALGSGETVTVITSQAPWNPAYDAVVAAYEAETGVDVDLRSFPNDEVKTQMLNDAQTGTHAFDVYQVNEVDMAQFNVSGLLMPLQDIDPDYQLDEEVFTYGGLPYWDEETKTFTEEGVLTSVPLLGNLQVFIYRSDIYEQLGLEVPETWAATIANGQEVIDAEAARYGYVQRFQGVPGTPQVTYDFAGILLGEGGSFFREQGVDWTPAMDSEEAIRAATIFRDLAELGPDDPKAVGQAEAIAAMQAGDSAQLSVVAAAANSMNDEANSNVLGKVGFAELPGGIAATGTWNLAVPADLPEERTGPALDFIKWVSSEEGMEVFVEAGGIPTRSDAYDADGIEESAQAYLDVVRQASETAQGPFRFEFMGEFLTVTEPILAAIAAGDVSPEEGMTQMQSELTAVVQEAGYPMN